MPSWRVPAERDPGELLHAPVRIPGFEDENLLVVKGKDLERRDRERHPRDFLFRSLDRRGDDGSALFRLILGEPFGYAYLRSRRFQKIAVAIGARNRKTIPFPMAEPSRTVLPAAAPGATLHTGPVLQVWPKAVGAKYWQ
jgi:hypothetical protein